MASSKGSGKGGTGAIRAAFKDARQLAEQQTALPDPPSHEPRLVAEGGKEVQVLAGQWKGAPVDCLPPDCPVVPLGRNGKVSYFIDSEGQMKPVTASEWGKRAVVDLFAHYPHFPEWAWPKWSAPKGGEQARVTGIAADDAERCLVKAAARRGLFDPLDRVRGRGAWEDEFGRLIWHAGRSLYTIEDGKLESSLPGELDGLFYVARPATLTPWPEPVRPADSPAQDIFASLRTWSWGRPLFDPLCVLGGIGCMLIGGALRWRPHLFFTGDAGVGKTELHRLIKASLTSALIDLGNTTEAGVRNQIGLDTLPVALDEMEASEDNRRAEAIMELARLSSSGARIARGTSDHRAVEYRVQSAFIMDGIIPPPMKPQDRSRFAMLDLNKLRDVGEPPKVPRDAGRKLLRGLMDAWPNFRRAEAEWIASLKAGGLERRQQDTYGTLFAVAELMLGGDALLEAEVPFEDSTALGEWVAQETAAERAEKLENWRECLEHLLGSTIDAWKGGEKATVGTLIANYEAEDIDLHNVRKPLSAAGLGLQDEPVEGDLGKRRPLLAVPAKSPALARLYAGSRWQDGGWWRSLRQGSDCGVVRPPKNIKINRATSFCILIDLARYDEFANGG